MGRSLKLLVALPIHPLAPTWTTNIYTFDASKMTGNFGCNQQGRNEKSILDNASVCNILPLDLVRDQVDICKGIFYSQSEGSKC